MNAVASEDTDCLAYGAEKVLVSFKATAPEVTAYDHKMVSTVIMFRLRRRYPESQLWVDY